jgi:hypothetical protein
MRTLACFGGTSNLSDACRVLTCRPRPQESSSTPDARGVVASTTARRACSGCQLVSSMSATRYPFITEHIWRPGPGRAEPTRPRSVRQTAPASHLRTPARNGSPDDGDVVNPVAIGNSRTSGQATGRDSTTPRWTANVVPRLRKCSRHRPNPAYSHMKNDARSSGEPNRRGRHHDHRDVSNVGAPVGMSPVGNSPWGQSVLRRNPVQFVPG